MPFKIVQTFEKGRPQLCIVPHLWEYKGLLRYPKKFSDSKLARVENSKPQTDWRCIACTLKRESLSTYEQAEQELSVMLQNSDTDNNTEEREEANQASPANQIDYNALADCLMINQNRGQNDTVEVQEVEVQEYANVEFVASSNQNNIQNIEQTLLQISNTQLEQNNQILILIDNQQKIINSLENISANQKKITNRVASLSVQIDELSKEITNSRQTLQNVVTLNDVQSFERENFRIEPINNITMLEDFELSLSDKTLWLKLTKQYAILCSASPGNGGTCAYKLLDVLFTREFMCNCSWSGGSRGETIKIGLKGYKNILNFFFELVHYWDPTFTLDDNTSFFKTVLKNANSRKETMNARTSTKRKRSKKMCNNLKKKKEENNEEKKEKNNEEKKEERKNDKENQISLQIVSEQNEKSANLSRVEHVLESVSENIANLPSGENENAK